jgi:hypothetical protein
VAPTRYRPELPQWLENIVLKAVAVDPQARFETAEEMLLALEIGERRPVLPPPPMPLAGRMRTRDWVLLGSVLLNLLLGWLLLASGMH